MSLRPGRRIERRCAGENRKARCLGLEMGEVQYGILLPSAGEGGPKGRMRGRAGSSDKPFKTPPPPPPPRPPPPPGGGGGGGRGGGGGGWRAQARRTSLSTPHPSRFASHPLPQGERGLSSRSLPEERDHTIPRLHRPAVGNRAVQVQGQD